MARKPPGARPPSSRSGGRSASRVTIQNPPRYDEDGNEKHGRAIEVEIHRESTVDKETGVRKTTYSIEVPRALRDRPFDLDEQGRMELARALAEAVGQRAVQAHGAGVGDYSAQHFMGIFQGTMYESKEGEDRMGKQTVGTYAGADAKLVIDELASRIEAVLEGQTPQTTGPASGYGYFATGVGEVGFIVMEKDEEMEEADRTGRSDAPRRGK